MTSKAKGIGTGALLMLCACARPQSARAQEYDNELSVFGGPMVSRSKIMIDQEAEISRPGFSGGVRYLRQNSEYFGLGMEALSLVPQERRSTSLIANGFTTTNFQSIHALIVLRLGPSEGILKPYLLAGLGAHATTLKIVSTPRFGFGWSDTGTTETRTLFNSRALGAAGKAQAGLDIAIGGSATLGGYAALHVMGNAKYLPTKEAVSLGISGARAKLTAVSYGMNASARF